MVKELEELNISDPFAIVTLNSKPKAYGWELLCVKKVGISFKYKDEIGSLGLYKNFSTDPSVFLEPYFGLFFGRRFCKFNCLLFAGLVFA